MLVYPRARLSLFNRLMLSKDCAQAFAETAKECGLLCSIDRVDGANSSTQEGCASLHVARKVLEDTMPDSHNFLWQEFTALLEEYARQAKQDHCPGLNEEGNYTGCRGMSPVLMDLLLQVIMRHRR